MATSWVNVQSELVDQRAVRLPPAWLSTGATLGGQEERGRQVHESGRGRVVTGEIVSLLEQAEAKVVVSSFLLADERVEDALLAAARRGVRVYLLLASEARLGAEDPAGEFGKQVLEQHVAMLGRLGGHVLFRSAEHFHAKLVVSDPETRPRGLLLTANLTTEALERNEELALVLTAEEVVEAVAYLKWAMWEAAEHELVDPDDRFRSVSPLGQVAHPAAGSSVVATTSATCSIREEVLRLVAAARSRIVVSSFGWDREHEVVRRLCERARAGVEVTVLARVRPSATPALIALAEAGARVLGFKWLHAKAVWIDSGEALVMSANLQVDGLDRGFELGVRLSGSRAGEVLERLTRWAEGAPARLVPAPTLGEASGWVKLWHDGKLVDGEVSPSLDVDLGTVLATSAHELSSPRPPLPPAKGLPRLAHELRWTWTVVAPELAPKAVELRRAPQSDGRPASYSPPVFREPGNRVVVAVREPEELDAARSLMSEVDAAAIVVHKDRP